MGAPLLRRKSHLPSTKIVATTPLPRVRGTGGFAKAKCRRPGRRPRADRHRGLGRARSRSTGCAETTHEVRPKGAELDAKRERDRPAPQARGTPKLKSFFPGNYQSPSPLPCRGKWLSPPVTRRCPRHPPRIHRPPTSHSFWFRCCRGCRKLRRSR